MKYWRGRQVFEERSGEGGVLNFIFHPFPLPLPCQPEEFYEGAEPAPPLPFPPLFRLWAGSAPAITITIPLSLSHPKVWNSTDVRVAVHSCTGYPFELANYIPLPNRRRRRRRGDTPRNIPPA